MYLSQNSLINFPIRVTFIARRMIYAVAVILSDCLSVTLLQYVETAEQIQLVFGREATRGE